MSTCHVLHFNISIVKCPEYNVYWPQFRCTYHLQRLIVSYLLFVIASRVPQPPSCCNCLIYFLQAWHKTNNLEINLNNTYIIGRNKFAILTTLLELFLVVTNNCCLPYNWFVCVLTLTEISPFYCIRRWFFLTVIPNRTE